MQKESLIIENPCNLYKKKLEIGIGYYDYLTDKKTNKFINPDNIDEIILTRGASSISTDIFKLNPNLEITIYNNGSPSHLIIPINNLPKIMKNEQIFNKISKHKKRKLAWIFCKAVCSGRIEALSLIQDKREENAIVKDILKKMRELDLTLIKSKTKNEMMGIEGNIAKYFYAGLSEFSPLFKVNRKRENIDVVNVMMNLGHTVLRNKIKFRLIIKGLNLNHGFLHERQDRNEDYLVWDFAEFWIPYIDKLIFFCLDKGIIKENEINEDGRLTIKAKNEFIKLLNRRIKNENIDKKIDEFVGYLKGENRLSWKAKW